MTHVVGPLGRAAFLNQKLSSGAGLTESTILSLELSTDLSYRQDCTDLINQDLFQIFEVQVRVLSSVRGEQTATPGTDKHHHRVTPMHTTARAFVTEALGRKKRLLACRAATYMSDAV